MSRRLNSKTQAAKHFQITEKTLNNWIGKGYIKGYRVAARAIVVDLDEVEHFLASVPPTVARDGRKVYGPDSQIVNLTGVVIEGEK